MKNVTLMSMLLVAACANAQNPYTFATRIKQSTIHDAIQLHYAKSDVTFYFKKVIIECQQVGVFDVMDLYYARNLGRITNFAPELGIPRDPHFQTYDLESTIWAFLKKVIVEPKERKAICIIQIDEPAMCEGLPLRKSVGRLTWIGR